MDTTIAKLRGRERARQYLLQEFERPDLHAGSRLPTNRELSAHLGLSLQTVQAAIRQLAQEGRVQTRAGSGTFLISKAPKRSTRLRIALSVPFSESGVGSTWGHRIASGIFQATLAGSTPASLVPLPGNVEGTDTAKQKLLAECSEVDGLILFPYSLYPPSARDEVCQAYEQGGKPVVHVLPPTDTATTNFVSLDYYGSSFRLGRAWRKTGRRRFWLVHARPLNEWTSGRLRFTGFVAGLGDGLGSDYELRTVQARTGSNEENGYQLIQQIPAKSPAAPDAIFCLDDLLMRGVIRALQESGRRVPQDVSVAGVETGDTTVITSIIQPLELLGRASLAMLLERIELKGASVPGRLVPTPFMGGATTRPEENVLLNWDQTPTNATVILLTSPRATSAQEHKDRSESVEVHSL